MAKASKPQENNSSNFQEPEQEQQRGPAAVSSDIPRNTTIKMVTDDKALTNDESAEREFTIGHAENLLKYEKSKGLKNWRIADDEQYKFENGSIIRK